MCDHFLGQISNLALLKSCLYFGAFAKIQTRFGAAKAVPFFLAVILVFAWPAAPEANDWKPIRPATEIFMSPAPVKSTGKSWRPISKLSVMTFSSSGGYALILDVIGKAESPIKGYDAVVYSAKVKPSKSPSQMTLKQIFKWIEKTPNQDHAIGRYQFIPKTLRKLVLKNNVPMTAVFTPALQDRLAIDLIDASGFRDLISDKISSDQFVDNLAKVWAGLPLSNGKNYYHGQNGNKATVSRPTVSVVVVDQKTPTSSHGSNFNPNIEA